MNAQTETAVVTTGTKDNRRKEDKRTMKLNSDILKGIFDAISSSQLYAVSIETLQKAIPNVPENEIAGHLSLAFHENLVGFVAKDPDTFSPYEFNLDELESVSLTLLGYAHEQRMRERSH